MWVDVQHDGQHGPDGFSEEVGLYHVVQNLPLAGSRQLCPHLFVERADGRVQRHQRAINWATAQLGLGRGRGVTNDLELLGRLHDLHQVAWRGEPLLSSDRRTFVWCYLDARYHGTDSREHLRPLGWKPVRFSTVRSEFRRIVAYITWAEAEGGYADDLLTSPEELGILSDQLANDSKLPQRKLLGHLAASRARWEALFGTGFQMPDLHVRDEGGSSRTISLDRTFDRAEVELVIRHERNPIYKAIFILAAYCGLRISEILHLWQCDVLPGSTAQYLFGHWQDEPLVILAHPSESKYIGDFTRTRLTRHQHLSKHYGLLPRHLLQGYRRAGWKHPLMTDRNLWLSEAFWSDREQAQSFAACMSEIRPQLAYHNVGERHPYLFATMRAGLGFGEPLAYSQVVRALDRACRRVGIEPFTNGRRIHGFRHFYKKQLEELGLSRAHIQVAMRHKSQESQDDYGRTGREVWCLLSQGWS
jgi:integrase